MKSLNILMHNFNTSKSVLHSKLLKNVNCDIKFESLIFHLKLSYTTCGNQASCSMRLLRKLSVGLHDVSPASMSHSCAKRSAILDSWLQLHNLDKSHVVIKCLF